MAQRVPMVPMMEVRRKFREGRYSVLSCASHSVLVRPECKWSRAFAIVRRGSSETILDKSVGALLL